MVHMYGWSIDKYERLTPEFKRVHCVNRIRLPLTPVELTIKFPFTDSKHNYLDFTNAQCLKLLLIHIFFYFSLILLLLLITSPDIRVKSVSTVVLLLSFIISANKTGQVK